MGDSRLNATRLWLEKASHDLLSAKVLLHEMPILTDSICFHCQQAAEKALKAYLIFQNCHVPKIHDLSSLVNECGKIDKSFHSLNDILADMTEYAVDSRYATAVGEIPLPEAQGAFSNAEKCMAFVKEKIVL
jgi:HEPN domain-containing protein